MNAEARQIQIDLITDTPNDLITWFNNLWSTLRTVKANITHDNREEILYYYDDKVIFCQYDFTGRLWISEEHCWFIFRKHFIIDRGDVFHVFKVLIENALGECIYLPEMLFSHNQEWLDNILKSTIND